jgi:hypothetical protein
LYLIAAGAQQGIPFKYFLKAMLLSAWKKDKARCGALSSFIERDIGE